MKSFAVKACTLVLSSVLLSTASVMAHAATIATVGNITITDAALKEQLNALTPAQIRAHGMDTMKEVIVQQLINDAVVLHAAEQAGIRERADYKSTIERESATFARTLYVKDVVNQAMTEENFQQLYQEKYGKKPQQEVNARHILLKTEEEANTLIAELNKGADFAELAKKHSTGPSGVEGGSLGWFTTGAMVKPFADAAFKLKKGEYTKTPVKTQFGWHIILVEDTRTTEPPKFADVRTELQQLQAERTVHELMDKLRDQTAISVNREAVKEIKYDRDPKMNDMPSLDDIIEEERGKAKK